MKKLLFFATAAVVLASCNNDVTISENTALAGSNAQKEIAFTPYAQMPKRAAGSAEYNAVDGTDFPQNYDMKVVAYSVPKTSPDDGVAGNYFGETTGQEFTYQPRTSNGWWAGTTAQYWPLAQASLNFLAVSYEGSPDANRVTPTFNSPDWASGVSVALVDNKPADANSAATQGQHDLMYAYGRGTVTKAGNTLVFPTKVDMTFEHALAWVYFRVKGYDATVASKIAIESITLKNAYYAGTFTAALTNYNSYNGALSWTSASWTAASGQTDVASPNQTINADGDGNTTNESQALTASFAAVGDGILVVPTSDLPSTVSFESFVIKYWMNKRSYNFEYTPTDADKTLKKGKKYIYDITMNLNEIFVDASVVDWKDSTTFVDIPATQIAYNESVSGAFTAAAAGVYSFMITGVPANGGNAYTVAAAASGDDIFASAPVITANSTTNTEAGAIMVTIYLKSTTGTKNVELKLNGTKKMDIAITRS